MNFARTKPELYLLQLASFGINYESSYSNVFGHKWVGLYRVYRLPYGFGRVLESLKQLLIHY